MPQLQKLGTIFKFLVFWKLDKMNKKGNCEIKRKICEFWWKIKYSNVENFNSKLVNFGENRNIDTLFDSYTVNCL